MSNPTLAGTSPRWHHRAKHIQPRQLEILETCTQASKASLSAKSSSGLEIDQQAIAMPEAYSAQPEFGKAGLGL
jgi:hypothetical protein